MDTLSIDKHRDEALAVLGHVLRDIGGPALARLPTRYSPSILADLRGQPVDPHSVDHSIRQIHDFYGWMAKRDARRGHCAGALYRTERFMGIERRHRNGSKKPERSVHIEHTVPIKTLRTVLRQRSSEFRTAHRLHRFLLDHSICVAFSRTEEDWLPRGKDGEWNDAFHPSGHISHPHPFRRYKTLLANAEADGASVRIFNVITRQVVDIDTFTFDMHVETLAAASRAVSGPDGPYLFGLEAFDRPPT